MSETVEREAAFWSDIRESEHLVQIYDGDDQLIDSMEAFVSAGFELGEAALVVATPGHRKALADRLVRAGVDLNDLRSRDQLIEVDAEKLLSQFMLHKWADEKLFRGAIKPLLARASQNDRRVRAFGEMGAILWNGDHRSASLRLEHLLQALCVEAGIIRFCAYPKASMGPEAAAAVRQICATHTKVFF